MHYQYNTKILISLIACSLLLFAIPLHSADVDELSRLRNELNMEKDASRLLGEKLLKSYEEKVVIENEIKEKEEKIDALEKELAEARKLMEQEIASHRKKIEAMQKQIDNLKKKNKAVREQTGFGSYIEFLEDQNARLKRDLAEIEAIIREFKKGGTKSTGR